MNHDFILLDRSGSMSNLWTEAQGSINAYVKKLADDKVDTGVTLAAFDLGPNGKMAFAVWRDRIIPSTWHPVNDIDGVPRGSTPLNDAIGRIVNLAEAGNYDKVAIVIMTDGLENSSREMSRDQAQAALERCRKKGWAIVFLGANFDNIQQAAGYGIAKGMTVNSSRGNLRATMDSLASKRADYGITGQAATMGWSDEEQEKAKS